ncbi:hypothetical protein D4N35_003890 [Siminovitchia fortis]|uniref:M23ase beta-sheet core domain-containing protein n=2 Tax=Siminovitchia fortis TaxID=254758 RepID=A0A443IZI4_9BACI|nr:hypothetical protein D4N35_003890 [Siminovitchia fortis]
MEEQQRDKDALEEKQAKVKKNLEKLNGMLKELEDLKADLNSQKAQKNEAMKNVKAEQAGISDEKKSLEAEISKLNAKQLEIQGAISTEESRIAEEARKAEEAEKAKATARVHEASNSSGTTSSGTTSSGTKTASKSSSPGKSKVTTTYHKPSAPVGKAPAVSSGMFTRPASGIFTSGFGTRWGAMHNGVDIAAGKGTPIVAAASGTVEVSTFGSPGNWGGYGNVIIINHGNGYKTLYGHMSSRSVGVGTKVSKGQVIGAMGNTGDVVAGKGGDGTHLHFEIFKNGSRVNPAGYINL